MLALLAVLSGLIVLGRVRGGLLLGAGWFFIALLPPSIVPLNVLVNEHRLYLPMVGGALFLALTPWQSAGASAREMDRPPRPNKSVCSEKYGLENG